MSQKDAWLCFSDSVLFLCLILKCLATPPWVFLKQTDIRQVKRENRSREAIRESLFRAAFPLHLPFTPYSSSHQKEDLVWQPAACSAPPPNPDLPNHHLSTKQKRCNNSLYPLPKSAPPTKPQAYISKGNKWPFISREKIFHFGNRRLMSITLLSVASSLHSSDTLWSLFPSVETGI